MVARHDEGCWAVDRSRPHDVRVRDRAGSNDRLRAVQNPPAVKPGVVMPAFGTAYGGSLSDDQIRAIIEYLQSLK